jgi:D-beta-D-heptose 7-phosphate kinase/D-beta-D-heptose 1-phosphate adenosyltransferase
VAVTLDSDGALILERDRHPYRVYATPEPRSHTAGAGDTFAACLALALAAGAEAPDAAELAGRAAGIAVAHPYTTTCAAAELSERLGEGSKLLRSADALARALASARSRGRRIVFTNGCFDIIHRGHVTYLTEAKSLGDVLVVGVNSDESVRSLKGDGRPVNRIDDRLEVLAALSCVDHLVTFDEPTPESLLRLIRPDVFVKGGDYTLEMLPEAGLVEELGGEVRILGYLEQHSTSEIIAQLSPSASSP